MFTYKLYVDTKRNDTLTLRITNNRKKAELSMGFCMDESTLADALSPNPMSKNLRYRSLLTGWITMIEDLRIDLAKAGRGDEDVKMLKEIIRENVLGEKKEEEARDETRYGTFLPFFIAHTEKYERRSTRESNEYTLSCMRKFVHDNLNMLNFEDINYAWLSDFESFMKKAGLSQNTRKIHFGNIRTAMREAYKRELTDADPFRRFSFRPAKTRKRSLTIDELRKLFDYPVEPYAEIYRDMMKLSFMLLGINTIDLFNLKEIKKGRIEYDRSKTGGLFSIKVEPEAQMIIDKYKGCNGLLCITDRWSDYRNFRHQLNAAIKRIGKAQGKGKKDLEGEGPFAEVTSYWMRHTWSTIAYELDIPDATISLALGHEGGENRTTNIYIHRNQKKVDEANRRVLDWVLYGKR